MFLALSPVSRREHLRLQLEMFVDVQMLCAYMYYPSLWRFLVTFILQAGILPHFSNYYRAIRLPRNRRITMLLLMTLFLWNLGAHLWQRPPPPDAGGLLHGIVLTEFIGVKLASRGLILMFDGFWFFSELLLFCIVYSEEATTVDHDIPELLSGDSVICSIDIWKILCSNWNYRLELDGEESNFEEDRSNTRLLRSPSTQDA